MIDALGEWMTQPAYFSAYGQEPPVEPGKASVHLAVRPVPRIRRFRLQAARKASTAIGISMRNTAHPARPGQAASRLHQAAWHPSGGSSRQAGRNHPGLRLQRCLGRGPHPQAVPRGSPAAARPVPRCCLSPAQLPGTRHRGRPPGQGMASPSRTRSTFTASTAKSNPPTSASPGVFGTQPLAW
jgi:hypothetical protein